MASGLLSASFAYAPAAEHGSCSLACSALPSHQFRAAPPALRAGAGAAGAHPGQSGTSPSSGVTQQPPETLSLQRVWRVGWQCLSRGYLRANTCSIRGKPHAESHVRT